MGAILKKNSWFKAKHNAWRFSLGSYNKATMAIANRMARIVYHILKDSESKFKDIGPNRVDPKEHQTRRAVQKLKTLGYEVTITPKSAA